MIDSHLCARSRDGETDLERPVHYMHTHTHLQFGAEGAAFLVRLVGQRRRLFAAHAIEETRHGGERGRGTRVD
jgi:hypothetical protein